MREKRIYALLLLLLVALLVSGCAGSVKNMSVVPQDQAHFAPEPGKAMVVFMRPSGIAFAIQSAVFDVVDEQPQLVGVVAAKKKVAYQAEPGEHLFMVTSESADFMGATLESGKVYYANVSPRPGAWKARFSLDPITFVETQGNLFKQWYDGCQWVVVNADTENWFKANEASIRKKQDAYYPKWEAKASKPMLAAEDGVTP